jgi:flagellar basal-body rod modification protein FlgD
MSTAINPVTSTSAAATTNTATAATTDPLASESTFLTLLVSQLQNQDPLDPVDSNQFVSQLTEYSQLEQLIGIHTDTTSLSQAVTTPATAPASTDPVTSTSNTNPTT